MPEDAPPPKLIRFPALTASVLAAITTAVLGSFIGTAGTLAGAGLASAVGGVATALYERGIERAAAKARARTGRTISPQARARAGKLASRKVIVRSVAGAAGIAVVTLGVITAAEYAAGRPVSDIVQGKHGTGLSVTGGGSVPHPAAPPVTPTGIVPSATPASSLMTKAPTGASVSPLPSATVTVTPPVSPTVTPAGGSPPAIPPDSATPIPAASTGETP